MLSGEVSIAVMFQQAPERLCNGSILSVLPLLMMLVLSTVIGWKPGIVVQFEKPVVIFSEPSHFSLIFSPFYLYAIVVSNKYFKWFFICIGLVFCILFKEFGVIICHFVGFGHIFSSSWSNSNIILCDFYCC